MNEYVILVDENDREIGTASKTDAHSKGLLHRAISVFIFNTKGQILLQKRAKKKYHSGGLWSNACCSHPMPGETTSDSAARRLFEEMKIKTPLTFINSFHYKTEFSNGLIEHEIDHVFFGVTDQVPVADPEEAEDWKYISTGDLLKDLNKNTLLYTSWLKICIDRKILGELISMKQ